MANKSTDILPPAVSVSYHDEQNGIFGCKHYARNCFLKAECCNQWYVCRLCHDETNEYMEQNNQQQHDPPPPSSSSTTYYTTTVNHQNNHPSVVVAKPHQINRYATKFVKCMRCGTEQNASSSCIKCTVDGHGSASDTSMDDDDEDDHDHDVHDDTHDSAPNDVDDHDDHDDEAVANDDTEHKQQQQQQRHQCTDAACCNHNKQLQCGTTAAERTSASSPSSSNCKNENDSNEQEQQQPLQPVPYVFGKYYCGICKFYDNQADKEIFHCPECGLCRIGNKTDFVHCRRCGCCLSYKYYTKHPCIENSLKSDCPICFTYLFKSTDPVTFFMPCGHPIHYECLMQYANVGNWNCPVCRARWHDVNAAMKNENDGSQQHAHK